MSPRTDGSSSRSAKTQELVDQMYAILEEEHPETGRQIHYQLNTQYGRENTKQSYKRHMYALLQARRDGQIPYEWVEDRLRAWTGNFHGGDETVEEYVGRMTAGLGNNMADGYWLDVWESQLRYIEVFVEKAALEPLFEQVLWDYDIRPNIGRGYPSESALYNWAQRLMVEENPLVLVWTDFDPSGEDMVRDLRERLLSFGAIVEVRKVGLTLEQVERYHLPHDFTKASDKRSEKHIAQYGDLAVELDALRPAMLRQQIRDAVESMLDMDALRRVRQQEREGKGEIRRIFNEIATSRNNA